MSIFSSLGNAIGGAYNAVKNTVSNFLTSSPQSLTSSAGMAFPVGQGLTPSQTQTAKQTLANGGASSNNYNPTNISSGAAGPMTSIVNGGSTAPVYGPAKPTSFSSGSTPTSYGASGSSNYSSPSYSANLAALSSSSLSPQPVSQTVSSGTLGSGTPSSILPSAPSGNNYASLATSGNIKVGANPVTGMMDQTNVTRDAQGNIIQNQADQKSGSLKNLDEYLANLQKPINEADLYSKAKEQAGLQQAQLQRNNTQNAINAVTAKMNTDLLQLRGTAAQEGVTEAVYGGQQAEVTREATIKLLPLQAQLAADQGNLELAQENTNTLFKMYADDAKNSADFYNNNAKAIYDLTKEEDKKKLDELTWQKNFNADIIKTDASKQSDLANKMAENGNWTAYRAITGVRPPTNVNSPTFAQDYQNYKNDLASTVSKYGASTGNGAEDQLYKGLSTPTSSAVRSVVNKFSTESTIQNFATIQEGYNKVKGLSDKTTNPTDDQALIYSLAKTLDPSSAVREGEYKTAQNYSQSWVQSFGKGVTQAINGTGFLTETARKNIKATIESVYKSAKIGYDNQYNQYVGQINNLTGRDDGTKFLRSYVATAPSDTQSQPVTIGGKSYSSGQTLTNGNLTLTIQPDGTLHGSDGHIYDVTGKLIK